jgi:hypothetical protein
MKSFIPHFIIIGATHAGAGIVVPLLEQHPAIANKIPNTQFFSVEYKKRDAVWYQAQFAGLTGVIGECSPGYLTSEKAPALIANTLQGGKMIVIVTHPILRLIAEYEAQKRTLGTQISKSCYQYAKQNPLALERGRYGYHLERFFAYYSPLQIQVLVQEDMVRDPVHELQALYSFLEVPTDFVPSSLLAYMSPPDPPKRKPGPLKRIMRFVTSTVKHKKMEKQKLIFPPVPSCATYFSPAELAALENYYAADVQVLSDILRRDLSAEWFPNQSSQ